MSLLSVAETSFSRIIDTDFSLADDLGHVVVDVNYLNVEVQFLTIRFSYAEN
jgi:hypothetical protein